jgi:hypothetical protein
MFDIYAPLQDFVWHGDDVELLPGLHIKRSVVGFNISDFSTEALASSESRRVESATHWLSFQSGENETLDPAEIENLFLLSLWLVKPTRTEIAFRFHVGRGNESGSNTFYRRLDRFRWILGTPDSGFELDELKCAGVYLRRLIAFGQSRNRLNNALILTIAGCMSHFWEVALTCHAAAVEGLLTHSEEPGITKRLAKAYACLVEQAATDRDAAYQEFISLYATRSDIIHGRTHKIGPQDRLPELVRFQKILREIWLAVIASNGLEKALEDTDAEREKYFRGCEDGYTPPNKKKQPS